MADEIPGNIQIAIAEGNLQAVQTWLAGGGNRLQARMSNRETLLHKAAYSGQVHIIRFLVEQGLSVNVVDSTGFSLLHEAARNGKTEAVRVLLELGADADAKRNDGATVDKVAGEKGAKDILALLRAARSKPRWLLTGPEEVSFVEYKPALGYRLTEIFNFKSRSYILITSNQQTNMESAFQRSFSDFGDAEHIVQAEKEFAKLGGQLPGVYNTLDKPRKGLSSRHFP